MRRIKEGWLQGYLRYTKEQESPEMFHFWVGVSLLSAVTARKVYIDQGFFKVFPNMFIILVAGSQKCKKSTSIHIGVDLIKNMEEYKPFILSQKMTPESLIDAMASEAIEKNISKSDPTAAGVIVADELSTYLDSNAIQRGMLPVLLKMYDCTDPFEYNTKTGGKQIVPKPYLNILAGSSPEYLKISLPSNEVGGGMLARTLLVYQEKPRRARPFIRFDKDQVLLKKDLVYDLMQISELEGAFEFSPAAVDWYEKWYYTWHKDSNFEERDASLENYHAKKPDHLFKLAQILSISEGDKLLITPKHLEQGLQFLNQNEKLMPRALGTILSTGTGVVTKKILDTIRVIEAGGVLATRKRILARVHKEYSYEEMQKALETLLQAGLVTVERRKGEVGLVIDKGGVK